MTRFEYLFPDVKPYPAGVIAEAGKPLGDQPPQGQYQDMCILNESGPCVICNEQTQWVDLCFESYVCSTTCESQLMDGFIRALNKEE